MRRAWGYCRVSLDKQIENTSLDNQRGMIEAICTLEGYELVGMFIESGVSGSVPLGEREQGRMLLDAAQGGDVIVSLKLDRMFRNVVDASATLADLQQRGVGLYLKDLGGDVTSSSVSALVFNLLSAVASFERERISERSREGMLASCAKRRSQGRHLGGDHVRFGYRRIDRKEPGMEKPVWYLEPIPEVHDQARQLKDAGTSLRAAAAAFQAQGHKVSHSGVASLWRALAA